MENTTPAPSVPPSVPPLKAYKFKRDYSFDNDNSISEKSALWTAKEGDIVVGRPFDHTSTTGEWIGLAGEKSGLVESDVLEEVPLTDEILQANNIIDVRNHFYERPSWLRRKWDSIREYWYYIFKAKYYILRNKVKMFDKSEEFIGNNLISGELTETMYLSLQENEQSKGKPNMVWTTDVKHGVVFGFFSAVALAKMFKKKNKNPEYQFSLSTASDIEFITYVQTGVKLKG